MENDALQTLFARRSIRSFKKDPVTREQFSVLEKAITLSPSAKNEQLWHFVFIEKQEVIKELEQLHTPAGNCYDAPLLLVAFGSTNAISPVVDTTFALANVMYACTSIGLGSCYINFVSSVFNHSSFAGLKTALGVPQDYFCTGALAIGTPAIEVKQPDDRKQNIFTYVMEDQLHE